MVWTSQSCCVVWQQQSLGRACLSLTSCCVHGGAVGMQLQPALPPTLLGLVSVGGEVVGAAVDPLVLVAVAADG